MRSTILVGLIGIVLLNLGCQPGHVTVTPLGRAPGSVLPVPPFIPSSAGQELVSSSAQMVTSASGRYKMSFSIGEVGSSVHTTTTNGTKVFTNVQGQLLSGQSGF